MQLQISKLDAARRQLDTCIRLYFAEGDPVAIHTLLSAGYQLLADINRARSGSPMLKEQVPTWVRPDAQTEARRRLSEAANFFKHADRDHDDVLVFSPDSAELLLYDACVKYEELAGATVPAMSVFRAWFWLGPGADLAKAPEEQKVVRELREAFPTTTRRSFFAQALPLVSQADV